MSTIYIYNTDITPSRNLLVDDIEGYLRFRTKIVERENFQHLKIELDKTIKLNLPQSYDMGTNPADAVLSNNINYLRLEQDNKIFYFFIMKATAIAQNTIMLDLSLDTINTFNGLYTFGKKTQIQREMRDRFQNAGTPPTTAFSAVRKIDRQSENISPVLYKGSSAKLYDTMTSSLGNDSLWYLIYQTSEELSTDNLNNPISCYLLCNKDIPVYLPETGAVVKDFSSIIKHYYINFLPNNGESGTAQIVVWFGGQGLLTTLDISTMTSGQNYLGHPAIHSGTIHSTHLEYNPATNKARLMFLDSALNTLWENEGDVNSVYCTWEFRHSTSYTEYPREDTYRGSPIKVSLFSNYTSSFYTDFLKLDEQPIFQTDSKTIKIIEIPYAPAPLISHNGGQYYTFTNTFSPNVHRGAFKMYNTSLPLERSKVTDLEIKQPFCDIPATADSDIDRNIKYESKLYNNEFYQLKIMYDSFEKIIPIELIYESIGYFNVDSKDYLDISMKITNTINSGLVFGLTLDSGSINWVNQFDEFLVVKRNLEKTIYSNQFVDYIRNGYRYDIKANTMEQQQGWLNTGVQLAGSVVGTGVSLATGNLISGATAVSMGTSAITSIASNIFAKAKSDNEMQAKLTSLKSQASSIQGSDDLDLMDYMTGNKLNWVISQPRSEVKQAVYDLFYYCGYACSFQGVPNLHSRKYFDFLQCIPDFDDDNKYIYGDFMDDIKARFQVGVTIMHAVDDGDINKYYNFDQDKENWEVFLQR